jgi:hypothetical protein
MGSGLDREAAVWREAVLSALHAILGELQTKKPWWRFW